MAVKGNSGSFQIKLPALWAERQSKILKNDQKDMQEGWADTGVVVHHLMCSLFVQTWPKVITSKSYLYIIISTIQRHFENDCCRLWSKSPKVCLEGGKTSSIWGKEHIHSCGVVRQSVAQEMSHMPPIFLFSIFMFIKHE